MRLKAVQHLEATALVALDVLYGQGGGAVNFEWQAVRCDTACVACYFSAVPQSVRSFIPC